MSQHKQPYNEIYPNLFRPFTIGDLTFKNRIFTAPAALAHAVTPEGFITDEGVEAVDESGESRFFEADTIILACGMEAKAGARDSFMGAAFDVIPAGDCITPGTLAKATKTGFYAGLRL